MVDMVEIDERTVTPVVTSSLIDISKCEGFACFAKGQYVENQWSHVPMHPCISSEISFEDFKERCRIQVSRCANSSSKYLTLKFCKVEL